MRSPSERKYQRRHREGEWHREAREAEIEGDRMRDHAGVFEQGVEASPVGGDGRQALEGWRRDGHHEEKEGGDAEHDRQHPGVEFRPAAAVLDDHDQRVERQHPSPEDDGAFERPPEGGDPVVVGRAATGGVGDVTDREIEGQERVDQEQHAAGEADPDTDGRALRGLDQRRAPGPGADRRRDRAIERQHQGGDGGGVADLGDVAHGVFRAVAGSPRRVLISSLYPAWFASWGALYSSECLAMISPALK
jgi:hypothetical protein